MAETVASSDVPPGSDKRALAVLFFLHAAAMAAYTVPLANVLKAYGISDAAITLAFCTGGVAAFISPMMAGSLADRRVPPERLLAALCAASACFLFLTFYAIEQRWGTSWVLGCMMAYALTNAPGFGLLTSIVLSVFSHSDLIAENPFLFSGPPKYIWMLRSSPSFSDVASAFVKYKYSSSNFAS